MRVAQSPIPSSAPRLSTLPPPRPDALLDASHAALAAGDHRRGLALADEARRLAEPEGGAPLAQALGLAGHHLWRLGRFEEAAVAAREAVPMWQQLDDAQGESDALCLLAVAYSELGLHEEALRSASSAFELARAHGLAHETTLALNRIGVCHERLGDPAQGERFLLQALSRAREDRHFDDTLQALNNLMANTLTAHALYRRQGDEAAADHALQRARQYGSQAMAMARRDADVYRPLVAQGNVAEVMGLLGEFEPARALLDGTIDQAAARGFRAVELRHRHQRAELQARQGDADGALAELQALRTELAQEGDHAATVRKVHRALYETCKALGRFEEALAHCEAFHDMETQRLEQQAQAQARLMVNRLDMEQALLMADRALMDAARERVRSSTLAAENRELEARSQALHRDAHEDPLTGLHNRRHMDQALPERVAQALAEGRPLQVAMLDVDRFKQVNDRHGHGVGDGVLREVARILSDRLRARDLAARLGGEEFLIVLMDTPHDPAVEVSERLRAAVQQHDWAALAEGLSVTVSIGVASLREGDDAASLLQRADAALYRAKHTGRNRVCAAD